MLLELVAVPTIEALLEWLSSSIAYLIPMVKGYCAVHLTRERHLKLIETPGATWGSGVKHYSMKLAETARTEMIPQRLRGAQGPDGVFDAHYLPLLTAPEEVMGILYIETTDGGGDTGAFGHALLNAIARRMALLLHAKRRDHELEAARANILPLFSPRMHDALALFEDDHAVWSFSTQWIKSATILFTDVRGFTALMSDLCQTDPKGAAEAINAMFSSLADIVHEFDGVVDKYLGDGMLVIFGDRSSSPDPHRSNRNAVFAAIKMQERMGELQDRWQREGKRVMKIGIGIHSGGVLQSAIGVPTRVEYTVIGDTVNYASRICDKAKAGQILISEEVYRQLFGLVKCGGRLSFDAKHPESEPPIAAYPVEGIKGEVG